MTKLTPNITPTSLTITFNLGLWILRWCWVYNGYSFRLLVTESLCHILYVADFLQCKQSVTILRCWWVTSISKLSSTWTVSNILVTNTDLVGKGIWLALKISPLVCGNEYFPPIISSKEDQRAIFLHLQEGVIFSCCRTWLSICKILPVR